MPSESVSESEVDRLLERLRSGDELRRTSEVFHGVSEPFIHVVMLRYDAEKGLFEYEYGGEGYPDEVPPKPYVRSRIELIDEAAVRILLRANEHDPYRVVSRSARST